MNTVPVFRRVALIGFGLIGGSIARAARAQALAGEIVTTARSEKTRARVAELGIADRVLESNAEAVKDADLVILCIPVGACGPVAQEIAPFLKPGAICAFVMVAALAWYLRMSRKLFVGILIAFVLFGALNWWIASVFGMRVLLYSAIGVFVVAWIGQFIGHIYEGHRPSFFTDLVFLLVEWWVYNRRVQV